MFNGLRAGQNQPELINATKQICCLSVCVPALKNIGKALGQYL